MLAKPRRRQPEFGRCTDHMNQRTDTLDVLNQSFVNYLRMPDHLRDVIHERQAGIDCIEGCQPVCRGALPEKLP